MSSSSRSRKAPKGDYIETDSGNKVSRRALISGTPYITLAGRTVLMSEVHLRGDLVRTRPPASISLDPKDAVKQQQNTTAISIGKCTIISTGTVLKPPSRLSRGIWTPYPLKIGDQVFIGPNCLISAALIHSHVHVGERSVLGPFCIVRENVKILPDTVVPANMVIPPGVVVGGRPATIVGEVGDGFGVDATGEGWVEGGDLRDVVRSIK